MMSLEHSGDGVGAERGVRIAVASGKGGTGKTLFATHLARLLAERGQRVTYVDADVEEPNGHLLLRPELSESEPATAPLPVMTRFRCSRCGLCVQACAFNAVMLGGGGALFFPELCHGCGNCVRVCPDGVLKEQPREIGKLRRGRRDTLEFQSGTLNVGEPRAVPLVDAVIARACAASSDVIIDCPPGSSCAVMAAVRRADLVLLVTEPTPFGWHDLRATLHMCFALGRPVAAIINRSDLGGMPVRKWLERWHVPVAGEMPFSRELARANAAGCMITTEDDPFQQVVGHLADALSGPELWDAARRARAFVDASAGPGLSAGPGRSLGGDSA